MNRGSIDVSTPPFESENAVAWYGS